jgi:hypothetical protein
MFDRISEAAEKLATDVFRRGFFGSVGRWAGAAALGMAGLLVSGKEAQANGKYGYSCNVYKSSSGQVCGRCGGGWYVPPGWQLIKFGSVANCKQCYGQPWGGAQCPF